ncbi:hypothetical protein BJ165DRAFT_1305422, partial [Panaeolus papilionaceus]
PFNSSIDWQVAHWAITSDVGHNSLDKLLAVPTVVTQLGLSFHNFRALNKIFEGVAPKAGPWSTKILSFDDRPKDTFTIYHHNPMEAIKAIWRDPVLSPQMKFAPVKVF